MRQAQVVECRFFGGMTEEETAEALGIGLRTAKRDWAKAKIWLHREIAAGSLSLTLLPHKTSLGG